jgi:C4-dicarboxylate-specific signal transduction histidine kinase
MEMIHDSLERYNISFELEIDPSIEHVMLPRNPLIQMLLNLFKNSMESIRLRMKQDPSLKGRIDVYVVPQQDEMFLLTVRDNGAGIDPEVAESLFHFGFTTKSTGSGFGLHASANFASSIGGDIRANSKGINQGAEMRVSLPLVVKKKG